jgi:hypothetical protein
MNTRTWAIAGVVVVAAGVGWYWITYVHLDTWKCFHVNLMLGATPHTDDMDRYCIAKRGPQNNVQWFLLPGTGMEDWRASGGASKRIRLDATTDEEFNKVFEFDLHVTDHMNTTGHQNEHKKPDFGYELTVVVPDVPDGADPDDPMYKATGTFKVGGGGRPIHAGTAHSNED